MTCGDGPWHSLRMSNDIAYPVFRTPTLLGRRVAAAAKELPEGCFRGQELDGEFDRRVPFEDRPAWLVGVQGSGLPAYSAAYEGRLPVAAVGGALKRLEVSDRANGTECPPARPDAPALPPPSVAQAPRAVRSPTGCWSRTPT